MHHEFENYNPHYDNYNEKMTWREILFIIPLIPVIVYAFVYIKIFDFFDNE